MGDVADMMLEGLLCEGCGVVIDGDEPGYPRRCEGCIGYGDPKAPLPPQPRRQRRKTGPYQRRGR